MDDGSYWVKCMNPNSFLFIRVYEPRFYICMAENEIKFYVGRRH